MTLKIEFFKKFPYLVAGLAGAAVGTGMLFLASNWLNVKPWSAFKPFFFIGVILPLYFLQDVFDLSSTYIAHGYSSTGEAFRPDAFILLREALTTTIQGMPALLFVLIATWNAFIWAFLFLIPYVVARSLPGWIKVFVYAPFALGLYLLGMLCARVLSS